MLGSKEAVILFSVSCWLGHNSLRIRSPCCGLVLRTLIENIFRDTHLTAKSQVNATLKYHKFALEPAVCAISHFAKYTWSVRGDISYRYMTPGDSSRRSGVTGSCEKRAWSECTRPPYRREEGETTPGPIAEGCS